MPDNYKNCIEAIVWFLQDLENHPHRKDNQYANELSWVCQRKIKDILRGYGYW